MKPFVRSAIILLLLSPSVAQSSAPESTDKKPLTIEAIFAEGGITGPVPESPKWSPDNAKVSFLLRDDSGDQGELWYVDASTGEKKVLVGAAKLANLTPSLSKIPDERTKEWIRRYKVAPYHWAPGGKHLLFDSNGQLWLYSLESGTAVPFASTSGPAADPKFSPDGAHVTYVRKHNLYIRPISGADEKQLTKDTDENLLNGEVDWVYAEELSARSNYFWSPDSKDIVFLQMDETKVPTYPITDWLPTHAKVDMQKYPQAGDPNPVVRLGVISAAGSKPKWISLTDDADTYIPRFGWVRDGLLWAEVLNRAQDELDLYFVDAVSGRSRKILAETSSDAWVNVTDDFKILKSGDRFLWTSWRDGYSHVYLYGFDQQNPLAADAKLDRQLTKGDFEILSIEAVDEDAGVVYFICNKDDPRQRQLFSVRLDGSGMQRVSRQDGTHQTKFSDDGKHYWDQFSALATPPLASVCGNAGSCQTVWQSRSVDDFGLATPKFLEFKAEDGSVLYGELFLPPDSVVGKIPVILNIYGGPAEQIVTNQWIGTTGLFHGILAQKGFAIFSVDNRGTPARGLKFQTVVRHQYGKLELNDQLTVLDQLFQQYPQLDRSRLGIWGWSNGGSMTLYAMTHSEAFKAGVAVAPVTDWRDYDSIYTERNNGLPADRALSYDDLHLAAVADRLHGSLLLVHGTGDDNVHFQNSIQMVDALIKAGKQFRFMVYPNKTHSIAGADARTHLFHMIEDHFERDLK